MAGLVFVRDAHGTPLMPMSPAYARRLLRDGKASLCPHHAFTIVQLTHTIPNPTLQQVVLTVRVHLHTAEVLLIGAGRRTRLPLLRLIVDLQTDLGWRMRRRAGHRRRRRQRGRYRAPTRYGRPAALRRPALARSHWSTLLKRRSDRRRPAGPAHLPATIRWRAQAIERVIHLHQRIRRSVAARRASHAHVTALVCNNVRYEWREGRKQRHGAYPETKIAIWYSSRFNRKRRYWRSEDKHTSTSS